MVARAGAPCLVFINNRATTLTALTNAGHHRPTVEEVLADGDGVWNPFFTP